VKNGEAVDLARQAGWPSDWELPDFSSRMRISLQNRMRPIPSGREP